MDKLFDLHETFESDPAIARWWAAKPPALVKIARDMFAIMHQCGPDVREALHDHAPTACIGNYPFAYVNVYKEHVNVGFFYGAFLPDPNHLLEGTGKRMRHVKIRPTDLLYEQDLVPLILTAWADLKYRIGEQGENAK